MNRRTCPQGCGPQAVVDQFTEADHGLAGAQEWGVLELACGHYLEGQSHAAALCLETASVGLDVPAGVSEYPSLRDASSWARLAALATAPA